MVRVAVLSNLAIGRLLDARISGYTTSYMLGAL